MSGAYPQFKTAYTHEELVGPFQRQGRLSADGSLQPLAKTYPSHPV
jgi:hypothetical protein